MQTEIQFDSYKHSRESRDSHTGLSLVKIEKQSLRRDNLNSFIMLRRSRRIISKGVRFFRFCFFDRFPCQNHLLNHLFLSLISPTNVRMNYTDTDTVAHTVLVYLKIAVS